MLTVTVGSNSFSRSRSAPAPARFPPLRELQTALAAYPATMGTAAVDANGNITFTASGTNTVIVSPAATAAKFGINVFTAYPANGTVLGQDLTTHSSTRRSVAAPSRPTTSRARR